MPEAEVSLRLAIDLLSCRSAVDRVSVAIDGAQVRTGETIHFDICHFLPGLGWESALDGRWQAEYRHPLINGVIEIHSQSGKGDVVATLPGGILFVAEAKKGPLTRSKSSSEYSLLREALGQLLTIEELPENAALAVAVPHSEKFAELAGRWRQAPLVCRSGIRILTVAQVGSIFGW
ncbi:MAG: hypothetical protein ACR65R_20785 [Methylomicrobium sp.]